MLFNQQSRTQHKDICLVETVKKEYEQTDLKERWLLVIYIYNKPCITKSKLSTYVFMYVSNQIVIRSKVEPNFGV